MEKDILTTAETAKLLGVSTRIAQLLIEGGSVPSWKTPGGHRRVYRADILAMMAGTVPAAPPPSATVAIVASTERLALYDQQFATVGECTVEGFADVHAASFAIGADRPAAIIVDLADAPAERLALLRSVAANPALGHSRIIAVAAPRAVAQADLPERVIRVEASDEAVAAVRAFLRDPGEGLVLPTDISFPIGSNERQRLVALERSGLVDSVPEESFDRLTWLAAQNLDTPIALMGMLTPTRQWFKSRFGLDMTDTPRSWAFCNHTILQKGIFSVEDLASDPRFTDNPAVAADPGFRFYAGAPVTDREGFVVGSLCVIDYKPRVLDDRQAQVLLALAAIASAEVRLRESDRQLHQALRSAERPAVRPKLQAGA